MYVCVYVMSVCMYARKKCRAQFFLSYALSLYCMYVCMYAGRLLNRLLQLSWMF